VFVSGALKTTAGALMKIANDIRWLGAGPRCGIHELFVPENEPGSSIMPGKVNPTQCEALTMVAVQVMGHDASITIAGSQGNFELNVFKPIMIANLLHAIEIMRDAAHNFEIFCIRGLQANRQKIQWYVDHSLMLVTALSPTIGYDKCAVLAHHALEKNVSLRDACIELGFLSGAEFDRIVDPKKMTGA
jgi:fumarate hydratase class II